MLFKLFTVYFEYKGQWLEFQAEKTVLSLFHIMHLDIIYVSYSIILIYSFWSMREA